MRARACRSREAGSWSPLCGALGGWMMRGAVRRRPVGMLVPSPTRSAVLPQNATRESSRGRAEAAGCGCGCGRNSR